MKKIKSKLPKKSNISAVATPNNDEYPVAMHTMTPPTERTYKLILASALLSLFLGAAMGYALGYTAGFERAQNIPSFVQSVYPQEPNPAVRNVTSTNPEAHTGAGCLISGCGDELCGEQSAGPQASICMVKPQDTCYATARCERQSNGACGWTETAALLTCLEHPPEQ